MKRLAVYLHIPFCAKKCPYCDFNSHVTSDRSLVQRYLEALDAEMRLASQQPEVKGRAISTIFFGGGTPSLLSGQELNRLLDTCREFLPVEPQAEITCEANPGTVTLEKLKALRQGGFNRLSFGAQSFQSNVLDRLGRIHSAPDTVRSVRSAREAGFENVSLDLIFSVPGQSLQDWQSDLQQAVDLEPDHLSTYSLTIEPGTEFGELYRKGQFKPLDEETDAAMYETALDFLPEAGYNQYEISNFAHPGRQCRHNLIYWHNEEWLGLGAGAHQHLNGIRRWNVKSPAKYVELMETRGLATEDWEQVAIPVQMGETMMVGLRLLRGVSTDAFRDRFGVNLEETFQQPIRKLTQLGLLHVTEDQIALTRKGILFANQACLEFV